ISAIKGRQERTTMLMCKHQRISQSKAYQKRLEKTHAKQTLPATTYRTTRASQPHHIWQPYHQLCTTQFTEQSTCRLLCCTSRGWCWGHCTGRAYCPPIRPTLCECPAGLPP